MKRAGTVPRSNRIGPVLMYRYLAAVLVAIFSLTNGRADNGSAAASPDEGWYVCEIPADCTSVSGEGGWPVAVRATRAAEYLEWVRSQAPFTTYFTPGDCFAEDEEFQAYVLLSRSELSCVERRCSFGSQPACTK